MCFVEQITLDDERGARLAVVALDGGEHDVATVHDQPTDAGDAVSPQVAVDGSGNAVAVWQQSDGTRYNIWANRYVPAQGWGTPTLVETDNAGDAMSPQVAVDGSGNAVAVWEQYDGTRWNIWANTFR